MLENKVEMTIQYNRKVRLSDITYQVKAAYGTIENIVTKKLKYQKTRTPWISYTLNAEQCAGLVAI